MKSGIAPTFFSHFSLRFVLASAIVLSLAFGAEHSFAQARPSSKTQVISIDPLGLAYNFPLTFQYEYKIGPVYSWVIRAHYWPAPSTGIDWSGFGVGGAYRIYIADSRAITGLSVEPAADLLFFRSSNLGKSSIVAWIGGDLAYKWIFDQFSIEPMFGLRIGFGGNEARSNATGAAPILALGLGYAW